MQANIRLWIEKAEQDFVSAGILSKRRAKLNDVVCFHSQQCVEKYLKALLIHHRVRFPKTHDLTELLNLLL